MKVECPVCGKECDKMGLENHMRLTNGMGHGPPGEYPTADEEDRQVADAKEIMVEVPMEPKPDEDEDRDLAMRDEMSVQEAVALHGEMLFNPEHFGHVNGADFRELRDQVEELRGEVRELRSQLQKRDAVLEEAIAVIQVLTEKHNGGALRRGVDPDWRNVDVYDTGDGYTVSIRE